MENRETDLQQDELATLKARADQMGVTYHPSIGLEKLKEKMKALIEAEGELTEEDKEKITQEVVEESRAEKRARKRKEAMRLVRIRVTCMNPAKREWEGEIFTAGNTVVGTVTKYVPFNTPDGWHVPEIIYKQIAARQCQIFVSKRGKNGISYNEGQLIKEFGIEILPDLTKKELDELARRQAMAGSVDS